jgi:urease accessory protein
LSVRIELGPGARLELIEVAATIAQHGRGGPHARLETTVHAAEKAALVWDAKPLVLCEGCAVERAIAVDLASGATALLRDTVVLGRAAEEPGALGTSTVVTYGGAPLHHEALDTADLELLRSPAVAGDAHVLDAVAIFGVRRQGPGVLQLAGPGSLLIIPAREAAEADAVVASVFRDWQSEHLTTERADRDAALSL